MENEEAGGRKWRHNVSENNGFCCALPRVSDGARRKAQSERRTLPSLNNQVRHIQVRGVYPCRQQQRFPS